MKRTKLYKAVSAISGVSWKEVRRFANGHRLHNYPQNADKIIAMEWPDEKTVWRALCPDHNAPKSITLPVGQIATVVGVSNCCGAAVVVEGHTTHWYACYECGMPCDVVKDKEASNGNG